MIGVALFGGFCAGIAAALAVMALLEKRIGQRAARPVEAERDVFVPENKELARLRQQLTEIDRYNGSEIGGY
ncbi:MAG: hypothetical protein IJC93_02935 [Clostridia bacterium]|nr:hypothetical protein [Clostridia bacterium]